MAKKQKIELIHDDSRTVDLAADLVITDPPYDMPGKELAEILGRIRSDHLVLITSMRQLLEFTAAAPEWRLSFAAAALHASNWRLHDARQSQACFRPQAPAAFGHFRRQGLLAVSPQGTARSH